MQKCLSLCCKTIITSISLNFFHNQKNNHCLSLHLSKTAYINLSNN